MEKKDNFNKYKLLRSEYPYFIFDNYSYSTNDNALSIEYIFHISNKYFFNPKLSFPKREFYNIKNLSDAALKNLVFNLGMIELISYWKATCSPKIIIRPHFLSKEQIDWWKKLYFNGLGEFFYLNNIKTDIKSFVQINNNSKNKLYSFNAKLKNEIIVPVGGGKDSVVTIETLNSAKKKITPLILNSNGARERTIKTAGFIFDDSIIVNRSIDPKLIELNKKGFLNGHTPFSAVLAFISLISAIISGKQNIALSNESSANESTIGDTNINHQYSKSYEFEKDFRNYVSKFINKEINYFSFLRPLNELQIAKIFSKHKKHFSGFRSCNVGSKTDSWCGTCPKCLFTFIILTPFVGKKRLIEIFNKDLFEDENLINQLEQLTGNTGEKPFECIGTIDEVNTAIRAAIEILDKQQLPKLLKHYNTNLLKKEISFPEKEKLLNNFDEQHFLSEELLNLLKNNKQLID